MPRPPRPYLIEVDKQDIQTAASAVSSNLQLHDGFVVSGSDTELTHFNLISQGSTPNLLVQAVVHITANANGEVTAFVDNFKVQCT